MIRVIIIIIVSSFYVNSQSSFEYFKVLNNINKDSIKKHLIYLASDELEGRGLGSKGIKLAANYISNQYSLYKLNPNYAIR
jgi:hypothetical protein